MTRYVIVPNSVSYEIDVMVCEAIGRHPEMEEDRENIRAELLRVYDSAGSLAGVEIVPLKPKP